MKAIRTRFCTQHDRMLAVARTAEARRSAMAQLGQRATNTNSNVAVFCYPRLASQQSWLSAAAAFVTCLLAIEIVQNELATGDATAPCMCRLQQHDLPRCSHEFAVSKVSKSEKGGFLLEISYVRSSVRNDAFRFELSGQPFFLPFFLPLPFFLGLLAGPVGAAAVLDSVAGAADGVTAGDSSAATTSDAAAFSSRCCCFRAAICLQSFL